MVLSGLLENLMKKQSTVASFKDAGYQAAKHGEGMSQVARFVISECPTFLDAVPDEVKAQLREGHALRWQELNKPVRYTADWVPSDDGITEVSLAYCMSYSQQAFGQLKNENPVQHSIIKGVRDKFNKYSSNVMGDLTRAVRRLMSEGKEKTKSPTKDYAKFLSDMFDSCKSRCKTAHARGDASAPSEIKLRQAIDAFYAQLK
jgi:hypothetical protein